MANEDFPFYRRGRSEYDDSLSRSSYDIKRKKKSDDDKFALGKRGILVFFTLSVLTLMAALDGTSLSVALPVSSTTVLLFSLHLTNPRILPLSLMGQPLKPSGVGLHFCYAQQVRMSAIQLRSTLLIPCSVSTQLCILLQHFWSSTHDHDFSYILLCWRCYLCHCK